MVGKKVAFALLIVFALAALLVKAADQTDFISIDCGETAAYSDETTSIRYVPDAAYIDTGVNADVISEFKASTKEQQFLKVRSFPDGAQNCYTLSPLQGGGARYLIRARFMYGNYDLKYHNPKFDIHLGVDYWETVVINDFSTVVTVEIIYVPPSSFTQVCLVNTGQGTPFISVLELRLLNLDRRAYAPASGSLKLYARLNMGSDSNTHRYPEDLYDRIWEPFYLTSWTNLSTSNAIGTNSYLQPASIVMGTAIAPLNGNVISFWSTLRSQSDQFYIYCYFADFQIMQANQSREIEIYVDGKLWFRPFKLTYLDIFTVYSIDPTTTKQLNVTIRSTPNSIFPPIINAFEAYTVVNLTHVGTYPGDDNVMKNIKSIYGVKKNWQGDPCVPQNYSWEGLHCSNAGDDPKDLPRIIFLNLSSSGLTNKEITSYISSLTLLQYLDLSHNNLTGSVPNFLSEMAFLTVLNLTGNNLKGNLPSGLIDKRNKKILTLIVDPDLCSFETCNNAPNPKNKNNIIIIVVCSLVALLLLIAIILALILWRIKKRKQKGSMDRLAAGDTRAQEQQETVALAFDTNQAVYAQRFTYSEILCITNNFQRSIGRGGFGTVYHGNIGNTQVAVKMLSSSTVQGYKQFHAEAKLLMRVHHRNLTTLVGYCDERGKLGLIYEYMENGDLQSHLSAKRSRYLTWEARLNIALDAAQGLEYLHNGCKPPIIHRDVKSTNILLNGSFQSKLADFGLSRVFPADEDAQTTVAGTPGYLDPEYYSTQRMSEKADVFGFGVVLLEIITGQPPITKNSDQPHISKWVGDIVSSSADITLITDPTLQKDFDINSAWKAVEVSMACVSSVPSERPDMNHVVIELKECLSKEKLRTGSIYGSDPIDSIEMEPSVCQYWNESSGTLA